ncbi:NADH-quinone oxidoreductase subunit C [Streptomyces roseolilacinus]|uniref:NADH-quinone oxidoreductase subunit C n=1 Tax=Streptomyces roseolilacinus TaxID=66904 RepID=UPI00380B9A8D
MNAYDTLPDAVTDVFGTEATAERAYDLLTVDVPAGSWIAALETARDKLGCTYFDWLSAVDEPGTGFRVCAHVVALEGGRVRRLLLRTTVPHEVPALPTAVNVYAGAAWHERETHEMFGVTFEGHPNPAHLLLPDNFEGHPLRKDFVLAARVAKAWPGAKEPGESEHGGPKRRQMLPPGVPDPNEWGPLKGQLPPAPARPARTPRAGAGAGAAERPPRRARTAGEGSAGQTTTPPTGAPATETPATEAPASEAPAAGPAPEAAVPEAAPRPRRTRTAGGGSATQRRSRTAGEGSASQREGAAPRGEGTAPGSEGTAPRGEDSAPGSEGTAPRSEGPAPERPAPAPAAPPRTRSADAPWNNPRPAFDDGAAEPARTPQAPPAGTDPEASGHPEPPATPEPRPAAGPTPAPEPGPTSASDADPASAPDPDPAHAPDADPSPGPTSGPDADPGAAPGPDSDPDRRRPEGDA